MNHPIGIGLVGFGWMGQVHTRSYRNVPVYFPGSGIRPRLVAVADELQDRAELARDAFGYALATTDWREVVEHPEVDVVDVTAPNALHQEVVEAAAAAGKHVFCEKPVGFSPEATAAIEHATRRAGVITGAGYNYRWVPLVQHTRALLEEGRFGEIARYYGRFFSMYGRDRLGVLSWRFLQERSGYGTLMDLMSHVIDLAHHLVGPIRRLVAVRETFVRERPLPAEGRTHYARGRPGDPTGRVTNEDYVGALVEFEGGARGVLEADRTSVGPQSDMAFELQGSLGAARWSHETLNQLELFFVDQGPVEGFTRVLAGDRLPHQGDLVPGGGNSIGFEHMKVIEALEFLSCVRDGRPYRPNFEDALAVASVQAAMIRSWERGAWEEVTSLRIEEA
ncbi:MAG TPA: Gfo/Idh/MocA family oxidoreductase [Actinomycetota bacterium]|nr:Gfo/Idh/MocA family oxidoreductase [Actinomycetota bacterium]